MVKKNFGQEIFGQENFLVKKNVCQQIFLVKKTCVKINLGRKNDFGQKIFLVTTIFDKKKLLKNYDTKIVR